MVAARARSLFQGGLIENDPLAIGGTTLTSAALSALPTITASNLYFPITLDPDGIGGAPEIAYITAHTAAATSATISRGDEGTTARAHNEDIRWVHAPTLADFGAVESTVGGGLYISNPTDGVTRSSTTLGALSTAWEDTLYVPNGYGIRYRVDVSMACAGDEVLYLALIENSTLVDRTTVYQTNPSTFTNRGYLNGVILGAGDADSIMRVYVASHSGSEITVHSTADTGLTIDPNGKGVSIMTLELVWYG